MIVGSESITLFLFRTRVFLCAFILYRPFSEFCCSHLLQYYIPPLKLGVRSRIGCRIDEPCAREIGDNLSNFRYTPFSQLPEYGYRFGGWFERRHRTTESKRCFGSRSDTTQYLCRCDTNRQPINTNHWRPIQWAAL